MQQSALTVNVSADNYLSQSQSVTLTSSQTLSFRLARAVIPALPATVEMSGTIANDDGMPVANAEVYLDFMTTTLPGTNYAHVSAVTDGAGVYHVGFTPLLNAMPHSSAAIAYAWKVGYDSDVRYIRVAPLYATQNFRVHRVKRITAGDSVSVTITPDDPHNGSPYISAPIRARGS